MTFLQKTILRCLKVQKRTPSPEWGQPKILAIQVAGMGDFVLAVPALRALRQEIPAKCLDLLTSTKGRRAAEGCPYVDEIYSLDIQSFLASGENHSDGWGEFISQIREIRGRRYDMAVNLIGQYTPKGAVRMGVFLKFLGIPLLAGRDTLGTGPFYHFSLPENLTEPRNERDTNLDLVRELGIRSEPSADLEVWPNAEDEAQADLLLKNLEGEGPVVGVNPGTDRPEKEWSEESYLNVMQELHAKRGVRFVLTGGPAEADLTGRLASAFGNKAVQTVGKISFQGTAALMRRIDLFLTGDTAALHLAWAAGVPTVVLFKEENLGRYRPVSEQITCLVGREREASAPLNISTEEVIKACLDLLDSSTIKT